MPHSVDLPYGMVLYLMGSYKAIRMRDGRWKGESDDIYAIRKALGHYPQRRDGRL